MDSTLDDVTVEDAQQCMDCVILYIKEIYEEAEFYEKVSNNSKLS